MAALEVLALDTVTPQIRAPGGSDTYTFPKAAEFTAGFTLKGSTSGVITVQPAAAAGTYSITLPTSAGSNGQYLQTNGSGVLSWATVATPTKTLAVFTPMTNQPPASNFATLDTRNSIALLNFDAATKESAVWAGVIPEAATLTNGIKCIISWCAATATSGDCVWGVQFEKTTAQDIDSDGFDTAATATTTTNAASGYVNTTTITNTNIDSLVAGNMFRVLVYRDAAAGGDTMTGDAQILAIELQAA